MLTICYGTRPEFIKIKPIIDELARRGFDRTSFRVVRVRQHSDLMDNSSEYDLLIPVKKHGTVRRLNNIILSCLESGPFRSSILRHEDSYVMVQGDTASAFGCALAAFNLGVPIIHLEAGLRSFDMENPWPEESYRRMISAMTTYHLCPTKSNRNILENQEVHGNPAEFYVVGNTVLDNIRDVKPIQGNHVICTMHRRENDQKGEWFTALDELAKERKEHFILVSHPSVPEDVYSHMKHVSVIPPMNHPEFVDLMARAKIIISDSGGLQEEGTFFGKRIVVCRETTERAEAIESGHAELCIAPHMLRETALRALKSPIVSNPCPFGDGHSAERIVDIFEDLGIV